MGKELKRETIQPKKKKKKDKRAFFVIASDTYTQK